MSVDRFLSSKGQFVTVNFTSEKKPAAKFKGVSLVKIVAGIFRAGVNFANLASVKDGIASGERGPVQPLAWGDWLHFPYVITHKGGLYYRLYPVPSSRMSVTYTVDGAEVDRDTFLGYLTPSERAKAESGDVPECITVKAENCRFID